MWGCHNAHSASRSSGPRAGVYEESGDELDDSKSENLRLTNDELVAHLTELLSHIPMEVMNTCDLIFAARSRLGNCGEFVHCPDRSLQLCH